eukprot:TRINITY_DN6019_c0_g1_i1.p1 TRINITY_DN6019_c0_g1~~TRINITY_DN6019_c0_g1_i1.p1  ORF type:complete len:154 (-),score=15.43 TRINITY_DN6019_c0_g1_i1:14-475(-)
MCIRDRMNPPHNCFASDIFALGMTLLWCSTLKPPYDCYEWVGNKYRIRPEKIEYHLKQLEGHYGQQLIWIISKMLVFDETKRMQLHEIIDFCKNVEIEGAEGIQISGFEIKEDNTCNYLTKILGKQDKEKDYRYQCQSKKNTGLFSKQVTQPE